MTKSLQMINLIAILIVKEILYDCKHFSKKSIHVISPGALKLIYVKTTSTSSEQGFFTPANVYHSQKIALLPKNEEAIFSFLLDSNH